MARASLETRLAVINLIKAGKSKTFIMKKLNVGRRVVDRWATEATAGRPNVLDCPRSGRPRKFDATSRRAVKRSAIRQTSVAILVGRYNKRHAVPMSRETAARILCNGKKPLKRFKIESTRVLRTANKQARAEFCQEHGPTPDEPWVYIDSKSISLTKDRNGMVDWAWQDPKKPLKKTNGRLLAHFHFYAAVAKGHKSKLVFVPLSSDGTSPKSPETFKTSHYVVAMQKLAKDICTWFGGSMQFKVIRDRASQHTKADKDGSLDPLNLPILECFPAQSWDINCIEHVWAQLTMILKLRRPRTIRGFKAAIPQSWGEIKQSTINKIEAKVPTRLERIAENGGEWIASYKG